MTIKKRLFCSNILMIAVPAAIAALIGLVCLGLLWFILHGGGGMHLEDGEDFSRLGRSVTRQLQGCLADDPDTWTGRIGGAGIHDGVRGAPHRRGAGRRPCIRRG